MKQFVAGIFLGYLLTASGGLAAGLHDHSAKPARPRGSLESFDYFRSRQLQLDIAALRQHADRNQTERRLAKPCQ
jgi:hypothetical protein